MLVITCLSYSKVGQSYFNHSGCAVKLILAFTSIWKVRQRHFKHCGGGVPPVIVGRVPCTKPFKPLEVQRCSYTHV